MSDSGFVHLTYSQLQDTRFTHLISGMDEDSRPNMGEAAVSTAISGYTEWVAQDERAITLGWDWQMLLNDSVVQLFRIGPPNSNLVLEGEEGAELTHDTVAALLGAFVDSFDWQSETLQYINQRYSSAES